MSGDVILPGRGRLRSPRASAEGWAQPEGCARAHYFERHRLLSLCAGVVHADEANRTPDADVMPDGASECAACRRLLRLIVGLRAVWAS